MQLTIALHSCHDKAEATSCYHWGLGDSIEAR